MANCNSDFHIQLPFAVGLRRANSAIYVFAFRKANKGRVSIELNRTDQGQKTIRFDAGKGDPSWGSATRVWVNDLPDDWIVMTRDLAGEFGEFDLDAITLGVPDGGHAFFDTIYLGREHRDLDTVQQLPSQLRRPLAEQRQEIESSARETRVALVSLQAEDGRQAYGTMVTEQGEVLTAGHFLARPNQAITVIMPDGRQLKGLTRGINRDLDLGVIKLDAKQPFTKIDHIRDHHLPLDALYFANRPLPPQENEIQSKADLLQVKPLRLDVFWSSFSDNGLRIGTAVIDQHRRLAGVLVQRQLYGGAIYARPREFFTHRSKYEGGEVWGKWPIGSGPELGVTTKRTREGITVVAISDRANSLNSPFNVGDLITKLDGQSVQLRSDLDVALEECNVGDKVTVEIIRDGKPSKLDVSLLVRETKDKSATR